MIASITTSLIRKCGNALGYKYTTNNRFPSPPAKHMQNENLKIHSQQEYFLNVGTYLIEERHKSFMKKKKIYTTNGKASKTETINIMKNCPQNE